MKNRVAYTSTRILAGALAAATVMTTPIPAIAQDEVPEARLRKIEAEVRALQRKVFPGGDGRFFEPQIAPDETGRTTTTTNPATTTAVTDILARIDAMELQLQRLTAMSEENGNTLSQLESRIAALETSAADAEAVAETQAATESNLNAMTGGSGGSSAGGSQPETTTGSATGPSPERLAAVRAITKPQTDDPGDDAYSYGFRLWDAKLYPEARQALSVFLEEYPNHYRATYGRNLMGRAFYDQKMYDQAAEWFVKNYQADKLAARAPDSLLYLAETMIAMDDTRRACIALAEFRRTFPSEASGRLSEQLAANSRKVTCSS